MQNRFRIVVFGSTSDGPDRNAWQLTDTPPVTIAKIGQPNESRSLLTFLLFGFIGGFILNLMPCVLPVISLKIFGFIQHAGSDRRRILKSGLSFIAGIFVWFIGLALILIAMKRAGHEISWALQFTNPILSSHERGRARFRAQSIRRLRNLAAAKCEPRLLGWTAREGDAGSFSKAFSRPFSPRPAPRRTSAPRSVSPSPNPGSSPFSCFSRSRRE